MNGKRWTSVLTHGLTITCLGCVAAAGLLPADSATAEISSQNGVRSMSNGRDRQ